MEGYLLLLIFLLNVVAVQGILKRGRSSEDVTELET